MLYKTTGTDKVDRLVGSDEQRYIAATITDAVEMLREDVRLAFGEDASDEVDESMLELSGDCVEVTRTDGGVIEICGDPESWEAVRENATSFDVVDNNLVGWGGYNHLYHVVDEHGITRLYFAFIDPATKIMEGDQVRMSRPYLKTIGSEDRETEEDKVYTVGSVRRWTDGTVSMDICDGDDTFGVSASYVELL